MRTARLRFEFAPGARSGPRIGRYLLVAGLVLLVLELTPIGLALTTRQQDRVALEALATRRASSDQLLSTPARPDPAYVARVKAASQVAKNLTMPWSDLLAALESAPQESVALMAVEPSSAKKVFRLTAEARDAKAMLAYVDALRKDRRLDGVVLVSHQLQVQAPGRPIRFQLQAGWEPAP
jgi:Tfp pilus assembly protein PilN